MAGAVNPLTPRELEVLVEYGQQGSLVTTGRVLGIHEQTVKNHLMSVYRKLHVHSAVRALVVAHQSGLLDVGKLS